MRHKYTNDQLSSETKWAASVKMWTGEVSRNKILDGYKTTHVEKRIVQTYGITTFTKHVDSQVGIHFDMHFDIRFRHSVQHSY